MEIALAESGLDFTRRHKKLIILLGLIGCSSYGVYKVYHMPSVVKTRSKFTKLFGAVISMAEMVSQSAETIGIVSKDLKEFLKSDSDEIPNSLKQLSKIAQSKEFGESLTRISQAMTIGILKGYRVESSRSEIEVVDESSFSDRIMDKLMSASGTGFISAIVGSFARNLVLGFYANGKTLEDLNDVHKNSDLSSYQRWVNVVSDDKCRMLIADCIKTFVSTAVMVYLDKTMDINFYDEIFSGLTNPKHQNKVKDVLVELCNGVVETLVKTSHKVLTSSKSNAPSAAIDDEDCVQEEASLKRVKERNGYVDLRSNGWVNSVSSTLSVPRNRKFVLDVTGRVTFETVRSVVEFFLWKITEGLKRSVNVVHDEVVGRGLEVVSYIGVKSLLILAVWLALFARVVSTRDLLPA